MGILENFFPHNMQASHRHNQEKDEDCHAEKGYFKFFI